MANPSTVHTQKNLPRRALSAAMRLTPNASLRCPRSLPFCSGGPLLAIVLTSFEKEKPRTSRRFLGRISVVTPLSAAQSRYHLQAADGHWHLVPSPCYSSNADHAAVSHSQLGQSNLQKSVLQVSLDLPFHIRQGASFHQ